MTRSEALKEMADTSEYSFEQMMEDKSYILKKLDIAEEQWNVIMNAPNKTESDYENNERIMKFLVRVKRRIHDGKK